VIERVDAVTLEDVHAIGSYLFSQPEVLAIVGPS
jgi:hypothetical protein